MASKGANAKSMKAVGGGVNLSPHAGAGKASTKLPSKGGNTKGASKSPLPGHKQSKGTGIAGRGTR